MEAVPAGALTFVLSTTRCATRERLCCLRCQRITRRVVVGSHLMRGKASPFRGLVVRHSNSTPRVENSGTSNGRAEPYRTSRGGAEAEQTRRYRTQNAWDAR